MIGNLLGNRYEIIEQVGGGGMSKIYRAKDTYLNRLVAVKILREHLTNDEDFVRRFRREAQAVASLSHPNIVSIYDVGQDGDIYYLIMEYVHGRNLKEIINEKAPLKTDEVIDIGKQICDALEHAHENKIIHRDIKPHNILITNSGKVKVTDFGIARAASTATVTHTNNIMGSVHYLSPEQAKGEIADDKTDIYSLGVVLYEMLTGKLPFDGDSPITIALKQIQTEPIPPIKLNPNIAPFLDQVILKTMAKDPKKRYEYARQLRMDLVSSLLKNPIINNSYVYENKGVTEDTIEIPPLAVKKELDKIEASTNTKTNKQKKQLNGWGKLLIGIFILSLIGGFLLSAKTFLTKKEIEVPNVERLPLEKAAELLEKKNLKIKVVSEINDPDLVKGTVIKQLPEPQQIVVEGREIEVTVSLGPKFIAVPNVVGEQYLVADVELTNKGFRVSTSQEFSDIYDKNVVIKQTPEPTTELPEGSTIELVISKGSEPKYIIMPNLSGKKVDEAKKIITDNGLEVGVRTKESSQKYPADFVISQEIEAGQQVLQGSSINLVISNGPGPAPQVAIVEAALKNEGVLKIVVEDIRGTTVAYEHMHSVGDIVGERVTYYGKAVIKVYVNNSLTKQQTVS